MRRPSQAIILLLFAVLPAISCKRGPKYEFPLVQKYTTGAGDVFYFRPRDGQFVLVERRKALAVAIAPEANIETFSYDDRITVSRPIPEPRAFEGQMLENRTLFDKISAQQVLAVSSDGRILASSDGNGVVSIWNIPNATREIQLNKTSNILSMAISPDGNFLAIGLAEASGEPADTIRLYDLRTHSTQRSFGRKSATSVAWSQDSRRVAVGLDDGSVLLAEAVTETEPRRIVLSTSPVVAIDFHPSGFFLASAHADKRLLIHKLPTAELIYAFEPPLPPIPFFTRVFERVAFDGNGARLAADYAEGEMRIWDTTALAKSLSK